MFEVGWVPEAVRPLAGRAASFFRPTIKRRNTHTAMHVRSSTDAHAGLAARGEVAIVATVYAYM